MTSMCIYWLINLIRKYSIINGNDCRSFQVVNCIVSQTVKLRCWKMGLTNIHQAINILKISSYFRFPDKVIRWSNSILHMLWYLRFMVGCTISRLWRMAWFSQRIRNYIDIGYIFGEYIYIIYILCLYVPPVDNERKGIKLTILCFNLWHHLKLKGSSCMQLEKSIKRNRNIAHYKIMN